MRSHIAGYVYVFGIDDDRKVTSTQRNNSASVAKDAVCYFARAGTAATASAIAAAAAKAMSTYRTAARSCVGRSRQVNRVHRRVFNGQIDKLVTANDSVSCSDDANNRHNRIKRAPAYTVWEHTVVKVMRRDKT